MGKNLPKDEERIAIGIDRDHDLFPSSSLFTGSQE